MEVWGTWSRVTAGDLSHADEKNLAFQNSDGSDHARS